MPRHYGIVTEVIVGEVIKQLGKRGYSGDDKPVTDGMTKTGLRCPLGDQDITELAQELGVAKSDVPPFGVYA